MMKQLSDGGDGVGLRRLLVVAAALYPRVASRHTVQIALARLDAIDCNICHPLYWHVCHVPRRSDVAGICAVATMASAIIPSSTPWRSLPVSSAFRNWCSLSVALSSSLVRRPCEPGPSSAASRSRV